MSQLRQDFERPLLAFAGIVGVVLLIACSNVANLLLARGAARSREMALRASIGAGRGRLVQQVMLESSVLTLAATALGVICAIVAVPLIVGMLTTNKNPVYLEARPDWRALNFVAALGSFTTALFGLAPALRASATVPGERVESRPAGALSGRCRARCCVVSGAAGDERRPGGGSPHGLGEDSSGDLTQSWSVHDHVDGRRFVNPTGTAGQPFSKVQRMLREPRTPWPTSVEVRPQVPPALDGAAAIVTFIGHATFLIQTAAGNILTDPIYSERASPLRWAGPRRVRQPGVRFDDLPPISTVLLSHNHYDHCDLPTLRRLAKRFDPLVVTPLGNGRLVRSASIRRVEELDWWQQATISALPITLTPAHHFSARTPFDRNRTLWGGFTLAASHVRIFFAGDSAYAAFFTDIRRRLGPIDLALLPIGAYEPRWFMQAVHMNPGEAVQAHLDLECAQSIGMHFGTFQLTTEGIDEPLRALESARHAHNVPSARFRTLDCGESVRLG